MEDVTDKPPLPLAGLGVRFAAMVIDGLVTIVLLLGLLAFLLNLWFFYELYASPGTRASYDPLFNILFTLFNIFCLLSALIVVVYYPLCWTSLGAGPGGRLLGLRIVQRDGSPIDFRKALIRFLAFIVSTLAIGLGHLWATFDAQKQTWHDRISSTYVVAERHVRPVDVVTLTAFVLLALAGCFWCLLSCIFWPLAA